MSFQVVITGNDDEMAALFLAGFDLVGTWPSHGSGPFGQPPPMLWHAFRRQTPEGQESSVVDKRGWPQDKLPEEWRSPAV